jgi:hypothetical protein
MNIPSADLTAARDAALPAPPAYVWDFRTRDAWKTFLRTLQAKVGPFPSGVDATLPGDGKAPVPAGLWALLMLGREVAVDALKVDPATLPTDAPNVRDLLVKLTALLSRAENPALQGWLNAES